MLMCRRVAEVGGNVKKARRDMEALHVLAEILCGQHADNTQINQLLPQLPIALMLWRAQCNIRVQGRLMLEPSAAVRQTGFLFCILTCPEVMGQFTGPEEVQVLVQQVKTALRHFLVPTNTADGPREAAQGVTAAAAAPAVAASSASAAAPTASSAHQSISNTSQQLRTTATALSAAPSAAPTSVSHAAQTITSNGRMTLPQLEELLRDGAVEQQAQGAKSNLAPLCVLAELLCRQHRHQVEVSVLLQHIPILLQFLQHMTRCRVQGMGIPRWRASDYTQRLLYVLQIPAVSNEAGGQDQLQQLMQQVEAARQDFDADQEGTFQSSTCCSGRRPSLVHVCSDSMSTVIALCECSGCNSKPLLMRLCLHQQLS